MPTDERYLSDAALSRRLERAEGRSNASCVEARARMQPESGACWMEVAGAYAMFDGPRSPLTQTFGLGLFDAVSGAEMDVLEAFFRERGADVLHEVSPMAAPALLDLLNGRGYQPAELSSVLYRPIDRDVRLPSRRSERVAVRPLRPGEDELWARTAAAGWADVAPGLDEFMAEIGRINTIREQNHCFLAEVEGQPVAAGAMNVWEGVALLAGASTLPAFRRQGAQLALLEARLRFAAGQGCDLAMMGALPGSASQRNAERQGFRIAYTRIKWRLAHPAA
jgi:GNAT superfamily N-acetyltransferase